MRAFFRRVVSFFTGLPTWVLVTVGVLIVIRIVLPTVCLWVMNRTLDTKLGVYRGHIEDFDLNLYRGAYQIQGLHIQKRDGSQPPILQAKEIDLSVAWRALLHKNISADVTIDELKVQLADAEDKAQTQTGAEEPKKNWEAVGGMLVPISIETLRLENSAVYFTNNNLKTPLPVALEKINLRAEDLRSRPSDKMSPVEGTAMLQGHAEIWLQGSLDLLAEKLRLDLDFKIEKFQPAKLNPIFRLYVPVDITKGETSLYGEVAAENGTARGYVKLFVKEGDIIAPGQDYLGVKHFFIEIATAFANWLLQNSETGSIAAKIPFHYDAGGLDVDASEAFWSAVQNRGQDLEPGIENSISLNTPAARKAPASTEKPEEKKDEGLTPEEWQARPGVEPKAREPVRP